MPTETRSDDASLTHARGVFQRRSAQVSVAGAGFSTLFATIGCWWALQFSTSTPMRVLTAGVVTLLLMLPFTILVSVRMARVANRAFSLSDERARRVEAATRQQDFAAKVLDALDMADNEPDALQVVERAFVAILPTRPVELLLADNSHAHLSQVAHASPDGRGPGCGVGSPQQCPAARRSRLQRFDDSEALNACPQLQGRPTGRCSAVCVPVSVMGRTVGVIHTTGEVGDQLEPEAEADLQSIAAQAGSRLGLLRIMAETQLQATTDGLTGLMNRRALENGYLKLRESSRVTTVAMADLDHFKQLNDTYGHATGDRALRVFAQTLASCLRGEDLVCRRGGEEFAIVFPDCPTPPAVAGLQRVQAALELALIQGGLPMFTVSFGVVEAVSDEEFEATLDRADLALFAAKEAGRNRVVARDGQGTETVYAAPHVPRETEVHEQADAG